MTEATTRPDAAPTTVGILREAHVALMREWRVLDNDAEKAARAAQLRERIRHAGCDIANPAERDEAQGLLDYWISAAAALPGQPYPKLDTLDEYVGTAGKRAGANARQVYEGLSSADERRVARGLFEELLNSGPQGVERAGALSRDALQRRLGGKNVDAVLAAFEVTGAIARRPGEKAADDLFEATDANLVEQWPELASWLDNRDAYRRRRDILLNRSQQWETSGRSRAYLARGEDLRDIDRFLDETTILDEYIKASKRGSRRFRSLALAAAIVAGSVFIFLALQSTKVAEARLAASEANEAKTAAERDKIQADLDAAVAAQTATELRRDIDQYQKEGAGQMAAQGTATANTQQTIALSTRLPLDSLQGGIWLGNDKLPQVSAPVWRGAFTPPSAARNGTAYRVLADINLRGGMPPVGGAYVSPPAKAVVRSGTLLVVTGPNQAYDRPTGRQFWAPVQIVPRVFIQYSSAGKRAADQLRRRLSEAGFDVPVAEQVTSAKAKREVRYFDDADRPIAQLLVERLGASAGGGFACRSFAGSRASSRFALEIWLDPAAAPRPEPAATCQ